MQRRTFLTAASAFATLSVVRTADAVEPLKVIRIGYQKVGALLVVKAQERLEKRFESAGVAIKWAEFPYGEQLLEAMSAGAIDYGYAGDAPPIFAQAGHANFLYAAAIPAQGRGQAIVVPRLSPIRTVADLRGRKVGVTKGSSAHNLLIGALESEKIAWKEITPLYLAPADAAAAFSRGAIDAWSIWDPFFALAEIKQGARALPVDPAVLAQNWFFLVNRDFATNRPQALAAINDEVGKATLWSAEHRDELAALYSQVTGVDLAAQRRAVARAEFSFGPLSDLAISQQQAVADRFLRAGLISAPIAVREIVWSWHSAG